MNLEDDNVDELHIVCMIYPGKALVMDKIEVL